ncbi:retropepsin-like aspartic protease [Okeania sp. SIO1I7]|uniref:retropepsin-like aspartic protease n=1 Tax=Okeania sp. SIO1I7 TaxID=2607772 RepID=UPI0013F7F864|nr:retropepsin-like aspartic protease [Okeania sp. SIO1I7]NET25341.1 clan AA aspartic protease [Okeania sp. SIO1I7]
MPKTTSIKLIISAIGIIGFIFVPQPNFTEQNYPTTLAQIPSSKPSRLSQEVLQELTQCVREIVKPTEASLETIQVASMQCTMRVIMLAPDGKFRPDANQRMEALLEISGASLPEILSQGKATVKLQKLTNSQVFTLPVIVAGKTKSFLLDTGASNTIIESKIAQNLGLASTPIPNDLLSYFVVGDDCSNVNANIHTLPTIKVDAATVKGLQGMGLSKTAIPGNLSGVLGLDFLKGFDVIINPQTSQLELLPPSSSVNNAIPLIGRMGVMLAEVKINGKGPFLFLLDTGADLMVLSQNLANELGVDIANAEKIDVLGFCGTEIAQKTKLDTVSLQKYEVSQLDGIIINNQILDLIGIDGIVGQNFLNRYQQHWRFDKSNKLGFPETGSLFLTPLEND